MIKINELRIGNYVLLNRIPEKVWGIDLDLMDEGNELISVGEKDVCMVKSFKENELSFIPITEEYLIKLVINIVNENNDGTFNYWNKENDCSIDVETHLLTNKIEKAYRYLLYERRRIKSIIYVHQLQNIFYALTGRELTLI